MTRTAVPSLAVLFTTVSVLAESPAKNSAIIGQWKGTTEGLPAVTLVVEEDDGKLMGAVLFYLIRRNPGAAPSASPGFPGPMIEPRFDGKTLSFKVSHRYAHAPRTLNDPPVSFRLELTGPDKAKLFAPELPPLEMLREKYKDEEMGWRGSAGSGSV